MHQVPLSLPLATLGDYYTPLCFQSLVIITFKLSSTVCFALSFSHT